MEPCDGSQCVVVALPASNPDASGKLVDFGLPAHDAVVDGYTLAAEPQRLADGNLVQRLTPLRLHLLHCILLI